MDEDMPFDFDIEDDARGVRALADKRRAAEREFMFIIIYISYCSMVRYQIIMVVGREVKNENADRRGRLQTRISLFGDCNQYLIAKTVLSPS